MAADAYMLLRQRCQGKKVTPRLLALTRHVIICLMLPLIFRLCAYVIRYALLPRVYFRAIYAPLFAIYASMSSGSAFLRRKSMRAYRRNISLPRQLELVIITLAAMTFLRHATFS